MMSPYKDIEKQRAAQRESKRRIKAQQKQAKDPAGIAKENLLALRQPKYENYVWACGVHGLTPLSEKEHERIRKANQDHPEYIELGQRPSKKKPT
jgi:hypothetical protein